MKRNRHKTPVGRLMLQNLWQILPNVSDYCTFNTAVSWIRRWNRILFSQWDQSTVLIPPSTALFRNPLTYMCTYLFTNQYTDRAFFLRFGWWEPFVINMEKPSLLGDIARSRASAVTVSPVLSAAETDRANASWVSSSSLLHTKKTA